MLFWNGISEMIQIFQIPKQVTDLSMPDSTIDKYAIRAFKTKRVFGKFVYIILQNIYSYVTIVKMNGQGYINSNTSLRWEGMLTVPIEPIAIEYNNLFTSTFSCKQAKVR